MGPGTGVAEAGAMVCCADAPDMVVAARIAPTHALRLRALVLVMTFPPCPRMPIEGFSDLSTLRLSPPVSVASRGGSSRSNTDTTRERFRDRELAVHNLERECRQGAGCRAIEHRRALTWIIVRVMTRAFENLLLCCPPIHLTTRV